MSRRKPSKDYDLNAGRNAFRSTNNEFDMAWNIAGDTDLEIISRHESAMRSFTESVDSDLPPAPILPPSLDIDYQYPEEAFKKSDTMDTIIERRVEPTSEFDETLGETQKYPMVVPGPGHVDAEQELHKSLLQNDANSESELEMKEIDATEQAEGTRKEKQREADFRNYRRDYNVAALQRPRPTTPTSWCAIETYVEEFSSCKPDKPQSSASASKMRVNIPGKDYTNIASKQRKTSVPWSDFYESMATQIPSQAHSHSVTQRTSSMTDYDKDILEENPLYKKMAPPTPVVHRRSSMDWENFENNSPRENLQMEQAVSNKESHAESKTDQDTAIRTDQDTSVQFEKHTFGSTFYGEEPNNRKIDFARSDNGSETAFDDSNNALSDKFDRQREFDDVNSSVFDTIDQQVKNFADSGIFPPPHNTFQSNINEFNQYCSSYQNDFEQTDIHGADGTRIMQSSLEVHEPICDTNQHSTWNENSYKNMDTSYQTNVIRNEQVLSYSHTSADNYSNQIATDQDIGYTSQMDKSSAFSNIYDKEEPPYEQSDVSVHERTLPQFAVPLFPQPVREPDPFSWEAQEAIYNPVGIPTNSKPEETPRAVVCDEEQAEKLSKKPPPRPVPPPPMRPSPIVKPVVPALPKIPPQVKKSPVLIEKERPTDGEIEEDAWSQFKKMTDKATDAVKMTEEKLKLLSETTTAKEIKDESYLAQIGGSQAFIPELAQKQLRIHKDLYGHEETGETSFKGARSKKTKAEPAHLDETSMDQAAEELVKKMAASRVDLKDWKPPSERGLKNEKIDYEEDYKKAMTESADIDGKLQGWADFDDKSAPELPPSESGFFALSSTKTFDSSMQTNKDPFAPPSKTERLEETTGENLFIDNYDPFDVRPAEDIVEAAKTRAATEVAASEAQADLDFFGGLIEEHRSAVSTPTQEGSSLTSFRPTAFEDEFRVDDDALSTPSPLYDDDDSEQLVEFPQKFTGEGWDLMVRYPIKKKLMGDRYWKPCFVKLKETTLLLYDSRTEQKPLLEILLQTTYSLSDTTLQTYDIYGKIHTIKLQYVLYKEKVGIRPGQISRLVEGHITKYGFPLEHSAQCTILLKFGSLNAAELSSFVYTIEDILFKCITKRDTSPIYKQDEVQIHCYDEYAAYVNKNNELSDQRARVRLFCLAFLTGSPLLEIGLNDRRRQGKEIVRRKDILPMYTERWIRFENVEFHNTVDKGVFDTEQVIRLSPPDGCFFEVMRFRVRPPKNREKPLSVKCVMKIAGSKVEIRIEAMAAAQSQKSKGGKHTKRQVPCEDIQIRFPIPEAWIYLFREERHWGVGSVHAKVRRPGKVKNLKDRLMGTVQAIENSLIEAAIGDAKYEHVYRALVWRIPRLPEKHHGAYKEHLLCCRFELSSFDIMPETFLPTCDVEFTMPLAMISNTVVRSVSVEQHEDSDRVEKFVRYVAKCSYKFEIDYIQCNDLDSDEMITMNIGDTEKSSDPTPEHQSVINPNEVDQMHAGYDIKVDNPEMRNVEKTSDQESSSDEEEKITKMPIIQIDMSNYGY